MIDDDTAELASRLQSALGDAYSVERPLGAGGFAVVFLVRDMRLRRMLAVRALSPGESVLIPQRDGARTALAGLERNWRRNSRPGRH